MDVIYKSHKGNCWATKQAGHVVLMQMYVCTCEIKLFMHDSSKAHCSASVCVTIRLCPDMHVGIKLPQISLAHRIIGKLGVTELGFVSCIFASVLSRLRLWMSNVPKRFTFASPPFLYISKEHTCCLFICDFAFSNSPPLPQTPLGLYTVMLSALGIQLFSELN